MIVIYGAGMTGKTILRSILEKGTDMESVLFSDSDSRLWGKEIDGVKVVAPKEIKDIDCSRVIIGAAMGRDDIFDYLTKNIGIDAAIIEKNNEFVESYFRCYDTRARFLESFAEIVYDRGIKGNIAEGGVFEGRYSRVISRLFPDRNLYLFDTFEGFDKRDVELDIKNAYSKNIREGLYSTTKTVEEIVNSLAHPEKAIVKKGFFPETAVGVDDEFVYVNLDFDLYKPTIEGLKFFYPRMVKGGIITIHDYFNAPGIVEEDRYSGIRAAAIEFSEEVGIPFFPIGDSMSVAFSKN